MTSIGKKVTVGVGKEAVRGTSVAATEWIPKGTFDRDPKVNKIMDESAIGVIEDAFASHVTKKRAEGTLEINLYVNTIGLLMLATFGQVATTGTNPYTHTFSILQSNSHPSVTLSVADDVQDKYFPLAMVDSMDMTADLDDFVKFSFAMKSKIGTDQTLTPAFGADYELIAKHLNLKFAANIAGLGAAVAICAKTFSMSVAKNLEEDFCLGSVEPKDFHNKIFAIEGSFEVNFEDETYYDYMLDGTEKAMEIEIKDSNVDLGGGVNPALAFTLAKVSFDEVAKSQGNDEIIKTAITFKALYSQTDTKMIEAVLNNTVASY